MSEKTIEVPEMSIHEDYHFKEEIFYTIIFRSISGLRKEEAEKYKQQLIDSFQDKVKLVEKGWNSAEEILKALSDSRNETIREEIKIKNLKEFLVKKIAELDQRISKWSNFTQSGQSQYSMVSLRLDTYKEILSEITGVSV